MSEIRKAVTTDNLRDMPFMEMLNSLEPFVLEDIPEGIQDDPTGKGEEVDTLLGRFANLYSYLMYLYSFASYESDRVKLIEGQSAQWKTMVRKKDALFELAKAVRMKWKACSRMLTGLIKSEEEVFDRVDYQARSRSQGKTPNKKSGKESDGKGRDLKGWGNVV